MKQNPQVFDPNVFHRCFPPILTGKVRFSYGAWTHPLAEGVFCCLWNKNKLTFLFMPVTKCYDKICCTASLFCWCLIPASPPPPPSGEWKHKRNIQVYICCMLKKQFWNGLTGRKSVRFSSSDYISWIKLIYVFYILIPPPPSPADSSRQRTYDVFLFFFFWVRVQHSFPTRISFVKKNPDLMSGVCCSSSAQTKTWLKNVSLILF